MSTETKNEIEPDYKIANRKAKELFDSLALQVTTSPPRGEVRENGWQCIAYTLTFAREGKSLTTEYILGIGHVDWKKATDVNRMGRFGERFVPFLNTLRTNPGATFKDKLTGALLAALVATEQKVVPLPHEVLACICADGLEASQNTFEDWADNLGYDKDSRKAESAWHACKQPYAALCNLIGRDNVKTLAEFHQQF